MNSWEAPGHNGYFQTEMSPGSGPQQLGAQEQLAVTPRLEATGTAAISRGCGDRYEAKHIPSVCRLLRASQRLP